MFRVSGRIVKLPVREANEVKKGDIIAELDKRDFITKIKQLTSEKNSAEAKLTSLKSGARKEDIASLKAAVHAAEEKVRAAKDQVERSKKLYAKGVTTLAKLEEHQTAYSVTEADLKVRQQELVKGQVGARKEDIDAQEAVVEGLKTRIKTAKDNLEDATLLAPFDGIIASRKVDNFVNIRAKEPIVVLQNIDSIDMSFDVPGADIPKFGGTDNLSIFASFDDIPKQRQEARLVEFSTQADSTTQTYKGRVSLMKTDGLTILAGMTGRVKVVRKLSETAAIHIPTTAIASRPDGKTFVWLLKKPENTVRKQDVKIGEGKGSNVRVLEGLKNGDTVVTAGLSYLKENMVVRPLSSERE